MRIERVVADASPLIILFKSGLAGLLPQLFTEILVPATVRQEVMAEGKSDPAVIGLANAALAIAAWAIAVEDPPIPPVIAAWDLDAGESSALAQALRMNDARVLLDDRAARNCAKALQIRTLGTAGVILLAKRRGLISSAKAALTEISDAGCWLSADLRQMVLVEAGEG